MGHMRLRCTDHLTHSLTLYYSSTLYGTGVKHSTQQKNPSTNNPRTYHVYTTAQQQQYSSTAERKKRQKKRGQGYLNQHTWGQQGQKKKQQKQGGVFELTPCLSRIERSTAEPKGNIVIPCRLREGNFEKSSLPEVSCCTDIFAYCLLQTMEEYSILRSTCLWFFLFR